MSRPGVSAAVDTVEGQTPPPGSLPSAVPTRATTPEQVYPKTGPRPAESKGIPLSKVVFDTPVLRPLKKNGVSPGSEAIYLRNWKSEVSIRRDQQDYGLTLVEFGRDTFVEIEDQESGGRELVSTRLVRQMRRL
jgi:hypothetical protein